MMLNAAAYGGVVKSLSEDIWNHFHASSVKTGMHRIGLLNFFGPNFAIKARAHRGLISLDFEFLHKPKCKMRY